MRRSQRQGGIGRIAMSARKPKAPNLCWKDGHAFDGGQCVRCGWMKTTRHVFQDSADDKRRHGGNPLDELYRNDGAIAEDREGGGRDLVSEIDALRRDPSRLGDDLARMGWSESGDDPYGDERES